MNFKRLLLSLLFFSAFLFNGCIPDEETIQVQFKPLVVRATIGESIQAAPIGSMAYGNSLKVSCVLGRKSLLSSVPNDVGQSVIEFVGTAVANTNLNLNVSYDDFGIDENGVSFSDCDPIRLEILYDGVVVYEETRELGCPTCLDSTNVMVNYILR